MSLREFFNRWGDGLAEILIPSSCVRCGPDVADDGLPGICGRCLRELRWFPATGQCRVCALPVDRDPLARGARCKNCASSRAPYVRITALGDYDGLWGELIRSLKFSGARILARGLGEMLAGQVLCDDDGWGDKPADILVPVPLSPRRRRERGFNQAEDLALPMARVLDRPLRAAALKRRHDGDRQVGRGRAARRRLPGDTFAADARWVWGRRVLLVDDVVTTTATLRAASRALLAAGALEVYTAVVARTGCSTDPLFIDQGWLSKSSSPADPKRMMGSQAARVGLSASD